MTDIRFYHLQRKPLEQALPEILEKVHSRGLKAVVMAGSEDRVENLNTLLWTYEPNSFLPHGTAQNGHAEDQPIWLTAKDENPNSASVLVLADGAASENVGNYDICCEIFDGTDETAVSAARKRWAAYKDAGHTLAYYQQDARGRWEQKQ